MWRSLRLLAAAVLLAGAGWAIRALLRPAEPPTPRDWPQWRYDAGRTAASPQRLPRTVHLQWVRQYPALKPAWTDAINRDRMAYDAVYEPVVAGSTMFVGFNASDKLVALDTRSGREKWRFYTDGPVRLPPAAWAGKVYFVSDDGFLYCLNAADGSLAWRFRAGPDGRKVLGNERLISAWPARGGPVVADGIVYFGGSIWPFLGTFLHALDARTGRVIWTNDGTGSTFLLQPHRSPAFAGPPPQGPLVVAGDRLLVPTGRSTPACFDRHTGRLLYYHLAANAKTGGAHVSALGDRFFNYRGRGADLYDLPTGQARLRRVGHVPVLTERAYYFSGRTVTALDPTSLQRIDYQRRTWDRKRKRTVAVPRVRYSLKTLWRCQADASAALILAGDRLYAGGRDSVSAINVPPHHWRARLAWKRKVDGTVARLLAADNRLFAVTRAGRIYCFGGEEVTPRRYPPPRAEPPAATAPAPARLAGDILRRSKVREGYAVVYGGTWPLLRDLALGSRLRLLALVGDEAKAGALRGKLDDAGLYGRRVAVHADAEGLKLPPYFASLTVLDGPHAARLAGGGQFLEQVFRSMRPYGGVAVAAGPGPADGALQAAVDRAGLPGARIEAGGGIVLLRREGPLPGAGRWQGQYGDLANTVCSTDALVRPPFGLLWFGGPGHADVLPRHAHGPPEQIVGGRLFIEGVRGLSARDVYTGRVLWKRILPDMATFGLYYDRTYDPDPLDLSYNQIHIPGANARGTNFFAADDAVYVLQRRSCLTLDPATGRTLAEFRLPGGGPRSRPTWGYLGVHRDLLIAGAEMMRFPDDLGLDKSNGKKLKANSLPFVNYGAAGSRRLVVMDRHSGQVRWTFTARLGLRHNAIAVGNGTLFCIDMLPAPVARALARRGEMPPHRPRLLAMNLNTGQLRWSTDHDVFGTWLSYSAEHDVLLEASRRSRDMLWDEAGDRMAALAGRNGQVLWDRPFGYRGPPILHGWTVYTQGGAVDLLTGQEKLRPHPLSGEPVAWQFRRGYGCNTAIASQHLLTFRSAAAGYYDLGTDGGTGNIGGFRSGCTSNLIAADGVLNAPDYTRTCTCSYQNQTSLALVHCPDVETWTFNAIGPATRRIRRVGLNLGAPGDRVAEDGTLWLDCPSVGGRSPDPDVEVQPAEVQWFRRHTSAIRSGALRWVAASGAEGVRQITVTLLPAPELRAPGDVWGPRPPDGAPAPPSPRPYTVRLVFAEPADRAPGERLFDVAIQGRWLLRRFDVAGAAGRPGRTVVKTFPGVAVADKLTVKLSPTAGSQAPPILCGIEAVAEGW